MVHLHDHILRGTFVEDASSTLVFDRNTLKRTAEARDRALHDLVFEEAQDDDPLICITTKRLRLESAIAPIDELMKNYAQRAARAEQAARERAAARGGSAGASSSDAPVPTAPDSQDGGVVV